MAKAYTWVMHISELGQTIADIDFNNSVFPTEGYVGVSVPIKVAAMNVGNKEGIVHCELSVNGVVVKTDQQIISAGDEYIFDMSITFQEAGDYNMEVKVWGEDEQ